MGESNGKQSDETVMQAVSDIFSEWTERNDGWFNVLSGHGTTKYSKSENSSFEYAPMPDAVAQELWRGDDICARIIEKLPEESFRSGFKLNMEDKGEAEELMAFVEAVGASAAFVQAKEFERAYGGAAIYPIINDGQSDLRQPLNLERIPEVKNVLVLEPKELNPSTWYDSLEEPKFGKPKTYLLQPQMSGGSSPPQVEIHESRLILFYGFQVSRNQPSQRTGWGDSVLNRVFSIVRDYNISWKSAAELLNDFAQATLKMKGLANLMATDRDDIVKKRIAAVQMSRSALRAVLLDSEEEFERKQTPISGMPELLDRFATRIATAADMPVTLLMGMSPAGLNATGESDIRFFYDRVAAEREKKTLPQLEQFVRLILLSKDGPTKGKEPDTWSVEFNPLWQPSRKEEVDARKVQADIDVQYMQAGVYGPDEVAKARFGGDAYSFDLHIDMDEVEDLTKELSDQELADAEAANAAAIGKPTPAPAGEQPVQATAMNGAQISSLISIVISAVSGEISRQSAQQIIALAFPTVTPDKALAVLGPEDFKPTVPEPSTPPIPPTPPGQKAKDGEEEPEEPGETEPEAEGETEPEKKGRQDELRLDKIEKRGDKWVVLSADGTKVLGTHDTEESAKKQLRAVEAAKHGGK